MTITATDSDGAETSTTFDLIVNNVAPTATLTGDSSVIEGATYTLNLAATDPGSDTISEWVIDWGDGSPVQSVPGGTTSVTHVYANSGLVHVISATVTDEDGTHEAANTVSVSVNDTAILNLFHGGGFMQYFATSDADAHLRISQSGGNTLVEGLFGTTISVNGAAPVSSITFTSAQMPTVTGTIFYMLGGDDNVQLVDVDVAGPIVFYGQLALFSAGDNDSFSITAENTDVTIGGPVIAYMTQGAGEFAATANNDHTLQIDSSLLVYGDFFGLGFSPFFAPGSTDVSLSASNGGRLSVAGITLADLYYGDDTVNISATTGGTVQLNGGLVSSLGQGANSTTIKGATIGAFAGIYGGNGADQVTLVDTEVHGALIADIGTGTGQTVDLQAAKVTGITVGVVLGTGNSIKFRSKDGVGSNLTNSLLITGASTTIEVGDASGTPQTINGQATVFSSTPNSTPNSTLRILAPINGVFSRTLLNVDEVFA